MKKLSEFISELREVLFEVGDVPIQIDRSEEESGEGHTLDSNPYIALRVDANDKVDQVTIVDFETMDAYRS